MSEKILEAIGNEKYDDLETEDDLGGGRGGEFNQRFQRHAQLAARYQIRSGGGGTVLLQVRRDRESAIGRAREGGRERESASRSIVAHRYTQTPPTVKTTSSTLIVRATGWSSDGLSWESSIVTKNAIITKVLETTCPGKEWYV